MTHFPKKEEPEKKKISKVQVKPKIDLIELILDDLDKDDKEAVVSSKNE